MRVGFTPVTSLGKYESSGVKCLKTGKINMLG